MLSDETDDERIPLAGSASAPKLDPLFEPESVAVVGASTDSIYSGNLVENLMDYWFDGTLYPVSLGQEEVWDRRCYDHISDVPETVDLAVVSVSREHVVGVVESARERNIPVVLILTTGFAQAEERDIGIVYISHDFASLTQTANRLAVMYLGRVIETGGTRDAVQTPKRPCKASLLAVSPKTDTSIGRQRVSLPGEPPNPGNLPEGRNFAPQCPKASEECRTTNPERSAFKDDNHEATCQFPVGDVESKLLAQYARKRVGVEDRPLMESPLRSRSRRRNRC
jgi:oligopeptide/dipeptide ABC transporter ATP-binding protein